MIFMTKEQVEDQIEELLIAIEITEKLSSQWPQDIIFDKSHHENKTNLGLFLNNLGLYIVFYEKNDKCDFNAYGPDSEYYIKIEKWLTVNNCNFTQDHFEINFTFTYSRDVLRMLKDIAGGIN